MKTSKAQDAMLRTTVHNDGDFIRTAVRLGQENSGSIIIQDRDGNDLFMLNLFRFDTGGADVDVIPIGQYQHIKVLAWDQGRQVLNQVLPPQTGMVAIDVRERQQ